jgi:hypothetical protein
MKIGAYCFLLTVVLFASPAAAEQVETAPTAPAAQAPSSAAPAAADRSDLTGRIGIGPGFQYSLDARYAVSDCAFTVSTKFGLGRRLYIEPSLLIGFNKTSYDNSQTDDKLSPFQLNMAGVIGYAILQKKSLNFYLKGGLGFSYQHEWYGHSNASDFIFSVPIGFGVEWWVVDNLAFDLSVMAPIFYLDKHSVPGNNGSLEYGMIISNMNARISVVFWF